MTRLLCSASTLVVLLFISTSVLAQVEPAPPVDTPCEYEVDDFTQEEQYSCDPLELAVEEQPRERIHFSRVMLVKTGDQPYLLFYVVSESWNFLSTETAYTIIDGKNFQFPFERVANKTRSGGSVEEQNAIRLDDSDLERLASASEFRMKAGQAVFRLPASDLAEHAAFILDN